MTKAADLLRKLKLLRCRAPFKDYPYPLVLVVRNKAFDVEEQRGIQTRGLIVCYRLS
jgi:hypothetical protein